MITSLYDYLELDHPDSPRVVLAELVALYFGSGLLVAVSTVVNLQTHEVDPLVFGAKTVVSLFALGSWLLIRYWVYIGVLDEPTRANIIIRRFAPTVLVGLVVLTGLVVTVDSVATWHAYISRPESIPITELYKCKESCATLV